MNKKILIKKGLVVAVILLFFSVSVMSSTGTNVVEQSSMPSSSGTTFYVDDDFNEETPGWNVTHFNKIQKAIGASTHGDTVFVYSGFYDEYYPNKWCSVFINKKINLTGEDKYTTIIDGSHKDEVIRIYADDINISGFTIQNSGGGQTEGSGIDMTFYNSAANTRIYGNIIRDNHDGIAIAGTVYPEIYDNIISDNYCGFNLQGHEASIYGNIIENNVIGMDNTGSKNIIQGNHFEGNEVGFQASMSKVRIIGNNFIDNDFHAGYTSAFINILLLVPFRQRHIWWNNYWDNWKLPIPKPILGFWAYYAITINELIGPFPSFQFDWSPAVTPYDIEV